MLCVSVAAVCGVVVLVVGRDPVYILPAARKRDESAQRVCLSARAYPLRGGRWPPGAWTGGPEVQTPGMHDA